MDPNGKKPCDLVVNGRFILKCYYIYTLFVASLLLYNEKYENKRWLITPLIYETATLALAIFSFDPYHRELGI